MKLINTNKYKFISQTPIAILNKISPCGASRNIAYFPVEIPRAGAYLSQPMKNCVIKNTQYGEKVFYNNISSPCGDNYSNNVGFGIIEVPLHSNNDPNNIVANLSHNLYPEKNRKHRGSFDNDDNLLSILYNWTDFHNGWKSNPVNSGNFFEGLDNNGKDILTPVFVDNDTIQDNQ